MSDVDIISRPELTLPPAEAERVRAAYDAATVILEYGSGGSTVLAAEMPGKTVFSVESDKDWAQMMRTWLAQNPVASGTVVDIIWSDIGETKAWGYPKNKSEYMRYARYPMQVWDLPEFVQPDVVLVDGRFRTGCAMATALRTQKPVTLLFDDYKKRTQYHRIEQYFGSPKYHGRMAEFDVHPRPIEVADLPDIIELMIRP